MKRILITLIALMSVCFSANAQLNVVKTQKQTEVVAKGTYGAILALDEKYGYVLGIASTNRYDRVGMIMLGTTKQEAITTLRDLYELCSSIGKEVVTIVPYEGETCTIQAGDIKNSLRLKFDDHAGYCILMNKDLQKLIDYFNGL